MDAGYVLENVKWGPSSQLGTPGGTVTWTFGGSFDPVLRADVIAAFDTWSDVADIAFVELADGSAADIVLDWADLGDPSQLAVTSYWFTGAYIQSAEISFNTNDVYHMGPSGPAEDTSGVLFEAVALHEIGHAIGLDHYEGGPAIMNAILSPQITELTTSDVLGAQAIYGPALAPAAGSGSHPEAAAPAFFEEPAGAGYDPFPTVGSAPPFENWPIVPNTPLLADLSFPEAFNFTDPFVLEISTGIDPWGFRTPLFLDA